MTPKEEAQIRESIQILAELLSRPNAQLNSREIEAIKLKIHSSLDALKLDNLIIQEEIIDEFAKSYQTIAKVLCRGIPVEQFENFQSAQQAFRERITQLDLNNLLKSWEERVSQRPNRLRSLLDWIETRWIEPFANLLDKADCFRIIEKFSPVVSAIGAILIPFVIWGVGQAYQEEQQRQDAMNTYFKQTAEIMASTAILEQRRLRIMEAATLTLLDSDLDNTRKEQVIRFLSNLELIRTPVLKLGDSKEGNDNESSSDESQKSNEGKTSREYNSQKPDLSLANVSLQRIDLHDIDLRHADLQNANLHHANFRNANLVHTTLFNADLREADLRDAYLSKVDLRNANLSRANLSKEANLSNAGLSDADLRNANLNGADLQKAYLRGAKLGDADLSEADLKGADLMEADLSGAVVTEKQLETARLCKTKLPEKIDLDPDRDCKELDSSEVSHD